MIITMVVLCLVHNVLNLCLQNSPQAPALTHGFWTGDIDLCYKDGAIPYNIFPFVALGFAENDQQSFKIIVAPQVGVFLFV